LLHFVSVGWQDPGHRPFLFYDKFNDDNVYEFAKKYKKASRRLKI